MNVAYLLLLDHGHDVVNGGADRRMSIMTVGSPCFFKAADKLPDPAKISMVPVKDGVATFCSSSTVTDSESERSAIGTRQHHD